MIPPITVPVAIETAAKIQALGDGLRQHIMGAALEQGIDGAIDHALLGYACAAVLSGQLAKAELALIDMREHSEVMAGLLDQAIQMIADREALLTKAYVALHGDLEGPTELMLALERPVSPPSGPTTVEFRTDTATFEAHSTEIIHDLAREITGVFGSTLGMTAPSTTTESDDHGPLGLGHRRAKTDDSSESVTSE